MKKTKPASTSLRRLVRVARVAEGQARGPMLARRLLARIAVKVKVVM